MNCKNWTTSQLDNAIRCRAKYGVVQSIATMHGHDHQIGTAIAGKLDDLSVRSADSNRSGDFRGHSCLRGNERISLHSKSFNRDSRVYLICLPTRLGARISFRFAGLTNISSRLPSEVPARAPSGPS